MDTDNDNKDIDNDETADSRSRPIGYWLRTVDAYITREFAAHSTARASAVATGCC